MTTSTTTTSVSERVAALRELAQSDPQAAQDAVWGWLHRLGADLPHPSAEAELAELFAAGAPAVVDGPTEGLLVGWVPAAGDLDSSGRFVYRTAHLVTERLGLMPWLGKKFDRPADRGTNMVSRAAVVLSKVLAPRYRFRRVGDHWEGFEMLNRIEVSVVSPGTDVLVLDYENIGTNPWPINQIRDEAVQLVPGTYLGAKLWHQRNGYRQFAYWAAKMQIPG
jgi:hypothetical protein